MLSLLTTLVQHEFNHGYNKVTTPGQDIIVISISRLTASGWLSG